MRFVVIGGDAAGMSAARRVKRNRPDLEVIVLEQSEDVSYSGLRASFRAGVGSHAHLCQPASEKTERLNGFDSAYC